MIFFSSTPPTSPSLYCFCLLRFAIVVIAQLVVEPFSHRGMSPSSRSTSQKTFSTEQYNFRWKRAIVRDRTSSQQPGYHVQHSQRLGGPTTPCKKEFKEGLCKIKGGREYCRMTAENLGTRQRKTTPQRTGPATHQEGSTGSGSGAAGRLLKGPMIA